MTETLSIVLVLIASVISAVGSLFFKKGSKGVSRNIIKLLKNSFLMYGFFMYLASSILYILALRGGELSVLYPLISTTYIWSSLFAVYFLREKMNRFKWMGVILIMIGVMLIGIGS